MATNPHARDAETLGSVVRQLHQVRFSLETRLAQQRGLAIERLLREAERTALETAEQLRERAKE